jgi:signal peptidase I
MGTTEHKKPTARQKRVSAFMSVVQVVLILGFVGLALMSFGTRIPFFSRLGLNFFAVTSGSMEPTIPTGALLYVKKVPFDSFKKDDIITYSKVDPKTAKSAVITHRIYKLEKIEREITMGEGEQATKKQSVEYVISTKGDANTDPDNYTVVPSEVIGVYQWHMPNIGYITAFAQTQTGFLLMVVLPAAILIVWEAISIILHFKQEYRLKSDKADKEVEALKAELAQIKREKSHEEVL